MNSKAKEVKTSNEELGLEFGDINAGKFFELNQAAQEDKKKDPKEKNNNAD